MFPYLTLMRPLNALMSVIAVIIGGLLVVGTELSLLSNLFPLILVIIAVFLITGAGNAINDYFDVDSDKINKPKRPIPAGRVSKRKALAFSILLFAIGILLTLLVNWACVMIAVINSILLVVYSYSLQDRILLGNIIIGYLVGSTFLFGGIAFGNVMLPLLLMLLAGLSTVTREIVKDLEDMEGDRKSFLKKITSGVKMRLSRFVGSKGGVREEAGFAMGKGRAKTVAALCMLLAIVISPFPYTLGILSFSYVLVLIPTDLIFIATVILLATGSGKKTFSRTSKIIKLGMFLALVAFIIGVIF